MKKILFALFCFTITAGILYSLDESGQAPGFANPDLDNQFVLSRDIFGKGWVILDFFATYCEPCKKELPEIDKLLSDKALAHVKLVIISVDEEGTKLVRPYFEKNPTRGTILIDRYKVTAEKYGVAGIPKLFLIGPDKKIIKIFAGYTAKAAEEIRRLILESST